MCENDTGASERWLGAGLCVVSVRSRRHPRIPAQPQRLRAEARSAGACACRSLRPSGHQHTLRSPDAALRVPQNSTWLPPCESLIPHRERLALD